MRIDLKGIHSTYAKLADGSNKIYWYAWRGGPRLRGEPGSPDFIASYNEAVAQRVPSPEGRLQSLLEVSSKAGIFARCASAPASTTSARSSSLKRSLASSRSRRSPHAKRAASFMDWRDKLALRSVGKPIMPGRCWRAILRGRRIEGRSRSIPARRAAASITARASISFGRGGRGGVPRARAGRICICRCCSRCGPGSGRAICCD